MTVRRPSTTRRRSIVLAASVTAVAACVAACVLVIGPRSDAEASDGPSNRPRTSTAVVERGRLEGTSTQSGRLGRPDGPSIGGALTGTITEEPPVGTVMHPRNVLYRVDDTPVVFLDGALPQWRPFAAGMSDGADVTQLESNLHAWGYLAATPNAHFDAATAAAVRAWQRDVGLPRTGVVEMGRVVFASADFVVADHTLSVGDPAGGAVYTTTQTQVVVTVDLPVGSPLARQDGRVTVHLPNGADAAGRVAIVGTATATDDGKTVVPTTIHLDDPSQAGDLTDASVSVAFVSEVAEDVLSVPVLALGASSGDGYVVEVVGRGGTSRPVPVTPGLFAGDRVAITGDVEAGQRVVVPRG